MKRKSPFEIVLKVKNDHPYLRTNTMASRRSHKNTVNQYFCPHLTSHTMFVTHLSSGEYFFPGWLLVEDITVTVTTGKEKKEEKERKKTRL